MRNVLFVRLALALVLGLCLISASGCCVADAFSDRSDGVVDDGDL